MAQPLTDAINALTTYANTVTGASDTTLSDAVATLASGYGGGGTDYMEQYLKKTIQSYSNSNVNSATPKFMFYEIGTLTSLSLPNALTIEQGGLYKTGISTVHASDFAKVFYLGVDAFRQCPSLTGVVLLSARQFSNTVFAYSTKLKYLDAGKTASGSAYLSVNTFQGCTLFDTLILRHSAVVTLNNISAFASTPFASGGSGGTLYVPSSLVSSYQSASNWSTILGYANNSIKSIESTHTDPNAPIDLTLYYADGTPIE